MNLLVKKKGLVFILALFLLSCEEPSELGLNLNPNQANLSSHFVEIPVNVSQVLTDSVRSASSDGSNPYILGSQSFILGTTGQLFGKVDDPKIGTIKSTIFTNVGVPPKIPTIAEGTQASKLVLRLFYTNSLYGQDISSEQKIFVYRLAEPIQPTNTQVIGNLKYVFHNYYITDSVKKLDLLTEASFRVDTTNFKEAERKRTNFVDIILPSDLATELMQKVINEDSTFWQDQNKFNEYFKGLALVPGEANTYINSISFGSPSIGTNTRMYLFYNNDKDSIQFPFYPRAKAEENINRTVFVQNPTFFHVERNFKEGLINTPAGGWEEFTTTSGLAYFQPASGLVPKFDLSPVKEFLSSDTIGEVVFYRAYVQIDSIVHEDKTIKAPSSIFLALIDDANKLTSFSNKFSSEYTGTLGSYKEDNKTINFYAPNIVGVLREIHNGNERFFNSLVYPVDRSSALTRFIVRPNQVKLKIYYTSVKK